MLFRSYRFTDIPFMHDEFSAVFRTNFLSFQELIEKGVKPDGHPAGIQVFLFYWIKIFGSTEWVVKLPFTVMGIFAILLVYLVAKKWYNETVGLISAAFIASIQYTVMYSQIARPYISGLFFSLLMVHYWSRLIDPNLKNFWKNGLLYVLASALCAYNHHFSLLFAALVGLSGLFLIPRKFLLRYILCGILIFSLYLPHIRIFINQFNTGGVGGWLAKPTNSFLSDYLYYILNYSLISVLLVIGLMVFGMLYMKKKSLKIKTYILFSTWFLLPFLVGFWYSLKINPVLQYSVLIFSFYPFLFILFGHIPNQKQNVNLALVLLILIINFYSLTNERKHYKLFYNSSFERIVTNYIKAKEIKSNIISVIDSHKNITRYYLEKHGADSAFTWFDSFSNEAEFINFLKEKSKTNYSLYLGSLASNKPNTIPMILHYFPAMQTENNYFLGSTYLFSKNGNDDRKLITTYNFESPPPEGWGSVNNDNIVDTYGVNNSFSYRMDSLTEYSPTFATPLNHLIPNEKKFLDVSVNAKIDTDISEVLLITTLESKDGVVHFSGADFKSFISQAVDTDKWITVYHSLKLEDINLDFTNLTLKFFVWNKGKDSLLLDDFKLQVRDANPVIYGLYEKIP